MNPLIFGYMRVPDEMTDEEVEQRQDEMTTYAEAEGLTLATVFFEFVNDSVSAFDELVDALVRAESRHVVIPSYRDLALTAALQNAMLLRLEQAATAQVVSLDECV